MTAELNAHAKLMGNVRKSTKGHKLKMSKKTQRRLNSFGKKEEEKEPKTVVERSKKESAEEAPKAPKAPKGPINVESDRVQHVKSERFYPGAKPVGQGQRAIGGASKPTRSSVPLPITPPGPAPRAIASAKAAAAKKGSKNKSTIKVAQPMVDLESPGMPTVHEITDVPRQWKKKNA